VGALGLEKAVGGDTEVMGISAKFRRVILLKLNSSDGFHRR